MTIDKTKASITLGALMVLGWLFRNPASLSVGMVGTAIFMITIGAWSLMKAVDNHRTKDSKFATQKLILGVGFTLLVFAIGMYAKRYIMGVEDTK